MVVSENFPKIIWVLRDSEKQLSENVDKDLLNVLTEKKERLENEKLGIYYTN